MDEFSLWPKGPPPWLPPIKKMGADTTPVGFRRRRDVVRPDQGLERQVVPVGGLALSMGIDQHRPAGVRGRLGEDPTKLGDSTLVPFERLAPAVGLVRFSMGYPARTADC